MIKYTLTYDDIQLVPKFSNVKTRTSINTRTLLSKRYGIATPIISAPMDTVCEYDMAYTLTNKGGSGCIHRFMTIDEQCFIVSKLKSDVDYIIISNSEIWDFKNWHAEIKDIPICAAIGVSEMDKERALKLVESGANVLVIDVAHGDHQNVIDMIQWCKSNLAYYVDIIAGNIATPEAAKRLEEAGADGLRVGVGGGSVCSTRIRTGFGVPNVTCIEEISKVTSLPIIADGGIKTSGDIVKALAVGASSAMIGSILAGTLESPGDIHNINGIDYKSYRGLASKETKTLHKQSVRNIEGESTFVPFKGSAVDVLEDLLEGIKSGLSYAGSESLSDFCPDYVIVTHAGYIEARPHLLMK